ncbi:hypothetical protein F5Y05DRAFT_261118 [Hypoxylon sp. FL0543]|nr:hypothetical protein F5Y05DRAFT_261118 [Hypoxylon sp. FL0543]
MCRTSRGVAGERAAVLEAQREAARYLEEEESRRKPSRGESQTRLETTGDPEKVIWSPDSFKLSPYTPKYDANDGRRADALPLKMEQQLDMALIKKGSFFYMSKNYVEKDEDLSKLYEKELDRATF